MKIEISPLHSRRIQFIDWANSFYQNYSVKKINKHFNFLLIENTINLQLLKINNNIAFQRNLEEVLKRTIKVKKTILNNSLLSSTPVKFFNEPLLMEKNGKIIVNEILKDINFNSDIKRSISGQLGELCAYYIMSEFRNSHESIAKLKTSNQTKTPDFMVFNQMNSRSFEPIAFWEAKGTMEAKPHTLPGILKDKLKKDSQLKRIKSYLSSTNTLLYKTNYIYSMAEVPLRSDDPRTEIELKIVDPEFILGINPYKETIGKIILYLALSHDSYHEALKDPYYNLLKTIVNNKEKLNNIIEDEQERVLIDIKEMYREETRFRERDLKLEKEITNYSDKDFFMSRDDLNNYDEKMGNTKDIEDLFLSELELNEILETRPHYIELQEKQKEYTSTFYDITGNNNLSYINNMASQAFKDIWENNNYF